MRRQHAVVLWCLCVWHCTWATNRFKHFNFAMECLFTSVILLLSNNEEICMFLAYAVTAEDIATFVAVLKDRLSCITTQNLPQHKDLFSEFLSFCSRRHYHHLIDKKLLQAKTAREECRDNQVTMHKKLVRTLSLNWKSVQHTTHQMAWFASARHIYLSRLSDPYPPRNHWVADTQTIYTKWEYELLHGKLHDKRTGRHPIHLVNYTKLATHILPNEDAFIYSDSKNCPNVWHFLIVCDIASHSDQTEPRC